MDRIKDGLRHWFASCGSDLAHRTQSRQVACHAHPSPLDGRGSGWNRSCLYLEQRPRPGSVRAVFYAAAKRGFGHGGAGGFKPPRAEATPAGRAAEQPAGAEYILGGEKAYLTADPGNGLRFAIGDEVQTPRDFDWQVQRRFNDWDTAWAEALAAIKAAAPADLESLRRFYEHVYEPLRDKLAARWSALRPPRPAAGPLA